MRTVKIKDRSGRSVEVSRFNTDNKTMLYVGSRYMCGTAFLDAKQIDRLIAALQTARKEMSDE